MSAHKSPVQEGSRGRPSQFQVAPFSEGRVIPFQCAVGTRLRPSPRVVPFQTATSHRPHRLWLWVSTVSLGDPSGVDYEVLCREADGL